MEWHSVYEYSTSLLEYAHKDLSLVEGFFNSNSDQSSNDFYSNLLFSLYFLHQSIEKVSKAYMTIIIGLLSLVHESLTNISLVNLKTSYLKMFVSTYLMRLAEIGDKQTIKITDLPEIFKKDIGHDERRIISFLNYLSEDISEHGRLTILIKEALKEYKYNQGDFFKILETIFDPSNRESLGYKLNLDEDILKNINQIIKNLRNNLGNLIELLNNVLVFAKINIDEAHNNNSKQEKIESHINEFPRYPIIVGDKILTWKDIIRDYLPNLDENQLKELINKTGGVKDNLYDLIQQLKNNFNDYKDILEQLLEKILT